MRKPLRWMLGLFALAAAVRLAAGLASGLSEPLVDDERSYAAIARSLADGHGFESPVAPEFDGVAPRTSLRTPLWPAVLAPVAAIGGGDAAFRVIAMLLGALSPPLLWLAMQRTSLAGVAHWPALALAAWPPSVYLSVHVLSEPLATVLVLGSLIVANPCESAPDAEPPGGGRDLRRNALMGVLLGLAVLARAATVVPAAFLVLSRGNLRRVAVCGATCTLVMLPWIVRNAALHGRPLLSTHTGIALAGGNSEAALAAEHPGKWVTAEAVYAGRPDAPDIGFYGWRGLTEEASDRRFGQEAARFVGEHPADAARLAAFKLLRFVDPDPRSMKSDAGMKRIIGWLTWLPALLLATLGLWASRADRSLRPFAWLLAGVLVTCIVFFVDARIRSGADPAILAFAAAGAGLLSRRRIG